MKRLLALALLCAGTAPAEAAGQQFERFRLEASPAADAALDAAGTAVDIDEAAREAIEAADSALENAAAAVAEATRKVEAAGRARFIRIGATETSEMTAMTYVDKESLKLTSEGYRRAWVRFIFRVPNIPRTSDMKYLQSLNEVDCAEGRYRGLSLAVLRHNSSSEQSDANNKWQYLIPDTAMHWIAEAMCGNADHWSEVDDPEADAAAYFVKRR